MKLSTQTRWTLLKWWLRHASACVHLPLEASLAIVISAGAICMAFLAAAVSQ